MSRTMGRLAILILACTIMFLTFHLSEGTSVGLNWGRMSKMKLLPSMVVEMLFANGVQKVKLHSFNPGIVQAFSGSNLEIMMTIPNPEVGLVSSPSWAQDYVRRNVTRAYKRIDLNVKYLMIGNEPYTMVDNYTTKYATTFDAALQHVTKYLKEQPKPYSDIKASIPHAPDVLLPYITKPSEADFNDGVKERMLRILQTLDSSGAPFVVNIYPHLSLIEKGCPFEFAFFDNDSGFSIKDGDKLYTNVFDFVYDSFVCALRKHGYNDMEIIVSQVGWPTDGHFYANISTAQRFYDGFIRKLAMDEGTPLRPGPMQVYLYNLHDENVKEITYRGPSMRHYGIYDYKGQPKLQMDLSMRGRKDVTLEPAHGVMSMPKRWCVYNEKKLKSNQTAQVLMEQFEYACSQSDCSKLFFGSSYNNLTFEGNISYAFNSYFQGRNQIEEECDFKGLGVIQLEDPSQKYGCPFPLQFISTVFTWGRGEVMVTLPAIGANAALGLVQNGVERLGTVSESFMMMIIVMPLLSLVFLLFRL